jgi:hypothetical protein
VLQRVAELSPEFSSSAYMTDTSLSRLKPLPLPSYYESWLAAFEKLLHEKGIVPAT